MIRNSTSQEKKKHEINHIKNLALYYNKVPYGVKQKQSELFNIWPETKNSFIYFTPVHSLWHQSTGACTLYLRKAVWTRRAASYSSLCSGSDRVSWARSRSTLLLEALMNSLQSAGEGSVDLSRGPSLNGDPPGLKLGLDDGVRGSLYRDLRKDNDTYLLFNSIYSTVYIKSKRKENIYHFYTALQLAAL